jgi:imidazolonepropionase-like amidohydrolase
MRQVVSSTDSVYALARKYGIKTAFGTDVLFSQALAERQGAMLVSLTRWYKPAEALIMATSTNAELLGLSGLRNAYPGKLGVVEEGALPTSCWSTAIQSTTSSSSKIRQRIFWSS